MKVKGENIKLFRQAKGLTIKAWADECQVSRQAASAWERGEVNTFRTLNLIAEKLGVKPELLLES